MIIYIATKFLKSKIYSDKAGRHISMEFVGGVAGFFLVM